jgi:hypothetical protein
MRKQALYRAIASALDAYKRCIDTNNEEWRDKHEERIEKLVERYMPSGSGFDNGTKFDFEASDSQRLFFTTAFHHMDEHGYYSGWTDHRVKVSPSLTNDFDLSISGKDRNDIKEYMYETFRQALKEIVEEYPE